MKAQIFRPAHLGTGEFQEAINTWLEKPDIRIVSKHLGANGDLFIFYETCADAQHRSNWLTIQEDAELDHLRDVARAIKTDDPNYADLKNGQQREIYLLSRYGINSKQADVVRELLRPEMAIILELEEKNKGG